MFETKWNRSACGLCVRDFNLFDWNDKQNVL